MFLDERDRGETEQTRETLAITIDLSTYFRGTEHSERNIGIQTTLLGDGIDRTARKRGEIQSWRGKTGSAE